MIANFKTSLEALKLHDNAWIMPGKHF